LQYRALKNSGTPNSAACWRQSQRRTQAGLRPKKVESWTNITSARVLLNQVLEDVTKGAVAVGQDPSQLHYADLRQLYIQDYKEQEHSSLRTNAETGEAYVTSLVHLDKFFEGMKVSNITGAIITKFKNERKAAGAANGTVNRALAALRRMFALATDDSHGPAMIHHPPSIKMLPREKPVKASWQSEITTNFTMPFLRMFGMYFKQLFIQA
jgi:Phage integrase, N-terminal SAM-like domain